MINKNIKEILKNEKDIFVEFNKNDTLHQSIIKRGFCILLIMLAFNINEELKNV